jgi:hydrogenase expression/formation protein HypC
MCLGIPGRVTTITEDAGLPMGVVDFGGARRTVCLSYTPEVEVGDYVVVHVGFAISRLDEAEALRTLEIIALMPGAMDQEIGPGPIPEPAARTS